MQMPPSIIHQVTPQLSKIALIVTEKPDLHRGAVRERCRLDSPDARPPVQPCRQEEQEGAEQHEGQEDEEQVDGAQRHAAPVCKRQGRLACRMVPPAIQRPPVARLPYLS